LTRSARSGAQRASSSGRTTSCETYVTRARAHTRITRLGAALSRRSERCGVRAQRRSATRSAAETRCTHSLHRALGLPRALYPPWHTSAARRWPAQVRSNTASRMALLESELKSLHDAVGRDAPIAPCTVVLSHYCTIDSCICTIVCPHCCMPHACFMVCCPLHGCVGPSRVRHRVALCGVRLHRSVVSSVAQTVDATLHAQTEAQWRCARALVARTSTS
jgi:hypothetical protein